MIPTFQIVPIPFNPFTPPYNLCDVSNRCYMVSLAPSNFNFLQNPQTKFIPFNYSSGTTIPQSSSILCQDKSTDSSINKVMNFQNTLQNKLAATNENQSSKSKKCHIKKQLNDRNRSLRKKIQPKNKILKLSQNRNRNIIPSVVQQIFSYLSKPNKSKSVVSKVFSLQSESVKNTSIHKYFYFIKQIKDKLNHYLNTNSLSVLTTIQNQCLQLIPREQQIVYLQVARRVAKHFLDNQLPQLIIHSKRMFQDKRIEHLRVRRLLIGVLQNVGC